MRADTEGKDKMMRRTRIAAATVMAAAGFLGAVAAPASAGTTHKLVHNFNGGGTVWMKVKVDKGKPKFVKDIRLSGLKMSCPDPLHPVLNPLGTHQDSGREEFPGKIRVKAGTKPPEYSKVLINDAMSQLDVTGTLRKKGKLSTVRMALTQVAGSGACFWGSTGFEASWVHGAQTAWRAGSPSIASRRTSSSRGRRSRSSATP
jgi:hypothetical protein